MQRWGKRHIIRLSDSIIRRSHLPLCASCIGCTALLSSSFPTRIWFVCISASPSRKPEVTREVVEWSKRCKLNESFSFNNDYVIPWWSLLERSRPPAKSELKETLQQTSCGDAACRTVLVHMCDLRFVFTQKNHFALVFLWQQHLHFGI